jgi:NAD(P)-dependent dehydrogenase (short-subunit alcohol dehydrogenase family)
MAIGREGTNVIKNRVALVTGGSRGIGRGIALELARRGHAVVVNYAGNEAAARETAETCRASGTPAEICQADVSRAEDRARLIAFTGERFGRLDLLVNNAGITSPGRLDLLEATEENFDRVLAVNLKGPFFLSQLAARWMIEQTADQRPTTNDHRPTPDAQRLTPNAIAEAEYRPKIVTVSSISAYAVSTNRADYCVAKAGLAMMTQLFAARLAEHGILVYEVRPGIIATDMTAAVTEKYDRLIAEGLTPIARWGTPEDVGRAVAAIAEDHFPFSTGETINVDGGFHIRRL